MDKYKKVENLKPDSSAINKNEIRITSQGLLPNYITYATALIQELHGTEIVLKAMGQAINKAVAITEIIKRRVPRLHQDTTISSMNITDVWEPIEEGLLPVEQKRLVSMIEITLSTEELNKNSLGYQAPAQDQQIRPQHRYQSQQLAPRHARGFYNGGYEESYGRGQGRGQLRGRNWSRGVYANYQVYGGYSNYGHTGGHSAWGYPDDGYSNYGRGGGRSAWGYPDDGGYSNYGRGGGRSGWGYPGAGYGRGRGGGSSRGYGRGRGLMGEPRSRGVANQS